MSVAPRVLVAGLFHETHTFLEGETGWEDFEVLTGDALLQLRGNSSPLGGVLEVAHTLGWDVVPTLMALAAPSAIVGDAVFEHRAAETPFEMSALTGLSPASVPDGVDWVVVVSAVVLVSVVSTSSVPVVVVDATVSASPSSFLSPQAVSVRALPASTRESSRRFFIGANLSQFGG